MIENPLEEDITKIHLEEVNQKKVLLLGEVEVQAMTKGVTKEANINSFLGITFFNLSWLKLLCSILKIETF